MKKLILIAVIATFSCFANAQDAASTPPLMTKSGMPITPQAGDWSLGFNAAPLLSYAGNFFNNNSYNSASMAYQMPQTIEGKMMKTDNTAMIGIIRIGFNSNSVNTLVPSATTAGSFVTDNRKNSSTNIVLGAGKQWYRGKGRLKGYYGATAMLAFSSNDTSYSYGNALSSSNPGSRVTQANSGAGFGIGVRGFVGAEYFFAPKMSLSAEYGWGIMFNSVGEGKESYDSWNGTAVTSTTNNTGSTSNFNIDVDNWGGAIILSLYF